LGMNPNERNLEEAISTPSPALIQMMRRLDGDLLILGVTGRMGFPLALASLKAIRQAGLAKRVIGAGKFEDPPEREKFENYGIETVYCDLLEDRSVNSLPDCDNVVFMAGREEDLSGVQARDWAINTVAIASAFKRFREAGIVVLSSASVYPAVPSSSGGSTETDPVRPEGETAQSMLAKERLAEYYSISSKTSAAILRLGNPIDLRYGILREIGTSVYGGVPIDVSQGFFNAIWLGDAVNQSLLCLEHCSSPPRILNITGLERLSVRNTAEEFARQFSLDASLTGKEGPLSPLSNPGIASSMLGNPVISNSQMIAWTAEWIKSGGPAL